MKKKILAIIATLFVVCSLGFGVAACNSISAGGGHVIQQGSGNTTQGSGSSNGNNNNGNTAQGNSSSNGDNGNNGSNGGAQANTPSNLTGLKYEFDRVEIRYGSSVSQEDKDKYEETKPMMNEGYKGQFIEFIDETTCKFGIENSGVVVLSDERKYTREGNTIKVYLLDGYNELTLSENSLIFEMPAGDGTAVMQIYIRI